MKAYIRILAVLLFTAVSTLAQAQNAEMADAFRSEGKIYVVVTIVLIVLFGLLAYLFLLDRKMNKLEQMIRIRKQTKQEGKSF